jgi:hemerythrin-like domain-containing protein
MQRDHRLKDLSDDHHQALVLARRANRAAAEGALEREQVWDEIVRRFQRELTPHFAIEEQVLLPALERGEHGALAQRTREEHDALRQLIDGSDGPLAHRLTRFGEALHAHVRFEERLLFPAIERVVSDDVLEAAATACRRTRE